MAKNVIGAGALALLLSSCASFSGPPPPCPRISILAGTDDITIYKPGRGRDLTDVEFKARFVKAKTRCRFDADENLISSDNRFTIIAERGPAAKNRQVEFPIYMALTRTNKQMIDKRQYPLLVRFPEGVDRVEVREGVNGTKIYLDKGEQGDHFEILVGFQLSRHQMDSQKR
ncbi:MAG: hypothetical protein ACPG1C_00315 [Alphaproteobacteria bacterium]